jgi:gliding motility-associated-like protein
MKLNLTFLSTFFILANSFGQTTIWTENFNNSCASGCAAAGYSGANGAWSVTTPGTNGAESNVWFVSGSECGMQPGQCGTGCGTTNSSLHVGSNLALLGLVDPGAAYAAGGAGVFNVATNKRAESPVINTTGYDDLSISFSYIENGQGAIDNAQLWVFNGVTWALLDDMPKTTCCGGVPCTGSEQGLWAPYSFDLPASTFDNPNVRIAFLWVNNDDEIGSDPSFAVDDVVIQGTAIGGGSNPPVADFVFSPSTSCIGSNVVFTDASTNNVGATYEWDFGPNATPATANTPGPHTVSFNALGDQTISLTVTNADGTSTSTQTFTVTPGPTVTTSPDVQICEGGSTVISASGASAYNWDNGLGIGASHSVSPTVTTTYTVTGVDVNGCSGTATVTITVDGEGPTLTTSSIDAVCFGSSTGQASVVAVGSDPFTYSWAPLGGNQDTASNLFPGNYTVSVTDAAGCTSNGSVTVGSPTQIQANAEITNSDCNQNNGSILLNPSGGNGSYSYSWLPGGSTNQLLTNLAPGNYQVTITDGNGCTQQFNFTIEFNDDFLVTVNPPSATINYQENVPLNTTVTPNIPGATYSWTPVQGLSCTNCPDPIASPSSTTTYIVTVTAPNSCSQSAQAIISVNLPCGTVFMPTIFSPNGDFLNDRLCVLGACIEFVTYTIYNRWGELVFESKSQEECWNGTFRGKPAPNGIYAYKFQVTLTDGKLIEDSGSITLVR